MQRLLAEADSMNRNYVAFTTDTALLRAVRLADRHGTNTDRVRARYLLGCAYRDMGEAPQALDCYHQALEVADTNSADCDYLLLAKVHGQAGDLFYFQGLSRNALEEYRIGERCALKGNDTLTAILAYGQTANCYYNLQEYDSTLIVSQETRNRLLDLGDTLTANTFLSQIIGVLFLQDKYDEAKSLLDLYQNKSRVAETKQSIPNFAMANYYQGRVSLALGQFDSARVWFVRFLKEAVLPHHRKLGYSAMFNLYSHVRQLDSITKYGTMFRELSDSIHLVSEQSHLQDIQGLYNYSRNQKLVFKQQQTVRRLRIGIVGLVFVTLLVCLVWMLYMRIAKGRAQEEMRIQAERYSAMLLDYNRRSQQLKDMERQVANATTTVLEINKAHEVVLKERERLQLQYEKVCNELALFQSDNKSPVEWDFRDDIMDSQIIGRIHHITASHSIPEEIWKELQELVDSHMCSFSSFLEEKGIYKNTREYKLCILIRLRFALSEISIGLDISSQNMTNIRSRLLTKMFGVKGGAKEFDQRILSIPR